jgi:hypothetical protein
VPKKTVILGLTSSGSVSGSSCFLAASGRGCGWAARGAAENRRTSSATPQPTSTAREVVRRTRRWRFSDQRAASGPRPVSIAARRSSAEDLRPADAESIGGWASLCRLRWDRGGGGGREPVRVGAGDRAGRGELQCLIWVWARGNLLCGAGVRRGCSAPARDEYGRVRLRVQHRWCSRRVRLAALVAVASPAASL